MKATLLKIYPDNPEGKKIDKVVEVLRGGGLVIYPTDTVYGLGCDLFNAGAIDKICRLKGIDPRKNLLSFMCQDLSQASEYAKNFPTPIFKLLKKTLPGPYTFILNSSSKVPKTIDPKRKTVGIRIPDHTIPLELIARLGNPIITTSVHDDDKIVDYPTDPELIYEKYINHVDIVIDGGMGGNVPSTVVDLTNDTPKVVREGRGDIRPFV